MTKTELLSKLEQAASLLSDVYHYACENGMDNLESNMSCADGCIIDAVEDIRKMVQ